jgi:hypothetical protein
VGTAYLSHGREQVDSVSVNRRSDHLDVVFLRQPQPDFQRSPFRLVLGETISQLAKVLGEPGRTKDDQAPRILATRIPERVRPPSCHKDVGARVQLEPALIDQKPERSTQHVEPFVGVAVDVHRWAGCSHRRDPLEQRIRVVGPALHIANRDGADLNGV